MLQHALYLLAAPSTSYLRQHLSTNLQRRDGGQFQMTSQGTLHSPPRPGWLTLKDPTSNQHLGAEKKNPSNLGYPRNRQVQSRKRQSIQSTLIETDQPVGPFTLDEHFGEPGHIPGKDYHPESLQNIHTGVWVVRTNQDYVYGNDTLGLDFY